MDARTQTKPIDILLVEDNPGDVRLIQEALQQSGFWVTLHIVQDGLQALDFLQGPGPDGTSQQPDLILLDLNLPRKDGRQALQEIKTDPNLHAIPVIVLTASRVDEDIDHAYGSLANCFIQKPVDFEAYIRVVETIEDFWLKIVRLPLH